jgi:hypothetical protein
MPTNNSAQTTGPISNKLGMTDRKLLKFVELFPFCFVWRPLGRSRCCLDGKIILKRILKKLDVRVWVGFSSLRIRINGGLLPSVSIWQEISRVSERLKMSRGSSGSIVSYYGLDDRAIEVRSPTGAEGFSSSPCVQTGSGAHPAQWVPGVLSPGVKRGRGVTLTTHPHLVPRLRMSRSYTSSPPMRLHGV